MHQSPAIPNSMRNVRPTVTLVRNVGDNTNGNSYTFSSVDQLVPPGPNQAVVCVVGGDDGAAATVGGLTHDGNAMDRVDSGALRTSLAMGVAKPTSQTADVVFTLSSGALDQCRLNMYLVDGVHDQTAWYGTEAQDESGADGELGFSAFHSPAKFDGAMVTMMGAINSQTNAALFPATSGIGGTTEVTVVKVLDQGVNTDTDGDSNLGSGAVWWGDYATTNSLTACINGNASPQRHRGVVGNLL